MQNISNLPQEFLIELEELDGYKISDTTYVGTVNQIRFFEHPLEGDESELIVYQGGKWFLTCFYEVPMYDIINNEYF